MASRFRIFLSYVGALGLGVAVLGSLWTLAPLSSSQTEGNPIAVETSTTSLAQSGSVSISQETPEVKTNPAPQPPKERVVVEESPTSSETTNSDTSSISRVQNPYPTPPLSFQVVDERTRAALVNILCVPENTQLRPISGSGVIIDPKGVLLTNAHVAQYVLLSQGSDVSISCMIRSGSPARPLWRAEVLYIPSAWIEQHASEITTPHPVGTGEYDYALLRITGPWDQETPHPNEYPSLPFDTRPAIGFPGDPMLATAYSAEFIGTKATQYDLYPLSSITTVQQLLTFQKGTADLMAFKGAAEAQSGSSGGPIVNAWGYALGIITTTSEEPTTADRELRAVTVNYINRDLSFQAGYGLAMFLNRDLVEAAKEFRSTKAPAFIKLLIDQIFKNPR